MDKIKDMVRNLDQSKDTSEERLKEVNNLLKEVEDDLIEYISSDRYRNWHVKNQNQFVCENDYEMKVFDLIANYLIYPDRSEYNILSKFSFNNMGWINDSEGNRRKVRRTLSLREVQSLYREDEDGWNTNESEYNFKKNVKRIHPENITYIEKLMSNDFMLEDTYILKIDFENVNHIKTLLRLYHRLKDLLIEEENYESAIWVTLDILDDLIEYSSFDHRTLDIIDLIKNGKRNVQIMKSINKCDENSYTYRQIEYTVGVLIPKRISESYKKIKAIALDKYKEAITNKRDNGR